MAGALLATIASGSVLASEPFDSNTDKGVLRLQLGATPYPNHSPPRFVYEFPGKPDRVTFAQKAAQGFVFSGKCTGALDTSGSKLATLTSAPYPSLGFGPDSIGVYDGPKGVACYRISASANESIQFGLGPDLGIKWGARTFYRLEIDIEVKQDARFELTVLRAGEPYKTWVLESGGSVTMPGNTAPGSNPFTCTARSDSGPDAGSGDNCRWVINEIGDGAILKATHGEGSLEGGGDFGANAYANNTLIYLTDAAVGVLGCGTSSGATGSPYTATIANQVSGAKCGVTRFHSTADTGGTCTQNFAYLMRTLPGGPAGQGCEITKNPGEQLVAVLDVTFPPEHWQALDAVPPTWVKFNDSPDKYYPPRCLGTLVKDENYTPTILEVLTDPSTLATGYGYGSSPLDFIPSTPIMDWACILEDEAVYIGNSPDPTNAKMQIRQRILFWGDFQGGRWEN